MTIHLQVTTPCNGKIWHSQVLPLSLPFHDHTAIKLNLDTTTPDLLDNCQTTKPPNNPTFQLSSHQTPNNPTQHPNHPPLPQPPSLAEAQSSTLLSATPSKQRAVALIPLLKTSTPPSHTPISDIALPHHHNNLSIASPSDRPVLQR